MTEIILFIAPGSCSRVPTILLEEIGLPFQTQVVRFMAGEHKSAAYKAFNPKGKVPALLVDGEALTENVAIASYLNARFPAAALLPATDTAMAAARQVADLCFCSATLHPLVTRIRMPMMFAGDEQAARVKSVGSKAMTEYFDLIEARLDQGPWWYGDQWSAMDAYLYWVFWRVAGAGFDVAPYPRFVAHARANEARPAVQRALAREAEAEALLSAEGLLFKPAPVGVS
ncbi:glutathione S-transferase family protein [Brevundimonas sp.]|uniref:glutathione S-transferase family protein n=1 Tax=Brevundimonas sp. TaxID=1871086 RepID=UPI001A20F6E6|nr:glutathione S-transferase family protein [Brevundimonas sp.]MBJ7484075.1 glutathione S-transferase family protein [Brevundimonas sp.]